MNRQSDTLLPHSYFRAARERDLSFGIPYKLVSLPCVYTYTERQRSGIQKLLENAPRHPRSLKSRKKKKKKNETEHLFIAVSFRSQLSDSCGVRRPSLFKYIQTLNKEQEFIMSFRSALKIINGRYYTSYKYITCNCRAICMRVNKN